MRRGVQKATMPETKPTPCAFCGQLRAALVSLVGVDGRADLERMEEVLRLMPAPAADKAIDAVHALIATLPNQG